MSAHVPAEQTSPAAQAFPHAPQFSPLLWRSVQMPVQSVSPAWHASAQTPAVHASPAGHAFPHPPQLAESLCVLVHAPAHSVSPA